MVSVRVQRPLVNDVTVRNTPEVVYLKGDNDTDGSLRIIPDTSFGTEAEFQLRTDGVWNDTGILIAASTVYLGRELQISAGGEWMLTKDAGTDIKSLIPHVRFDSSQGTDETVVVPAVGVLNSDIILQPDDTGESEQSQFQFTAVSASLVLANALILKTAGGGATGPVTISLFRDGFGSGLFYQRTYPISSFPADSDIKVTTDGLVELLAGETFYVDISLNSGGFLDLKMDTTNTTPYWGGDFYFVTEDTITPDEQGGATRYLLFDEDGDVIIDDAGNALLGFDLDDVERIPTPSVSSPFGLSVSFGGTTSTDLVAASPMSMYKFTGTSGGTLTLSDTLKQYATPNRDWYFGVKDQGGNCTASPLTIAPESGLIDGASSIQIVINQGSFYGYTDGTDYWSLA